jgi:protein kinase A
VAEIQLDVVPNGVVNTVQSRKKNLSPCSAPSDFEIGVILGTGTYGKVRVGRHRATGTIVAIKSISKARTIEGHQVPHILSEREILAHIEFPFCVSLRGTFQDPDDVYLVMDFVPGGELFRLLVEHGSFPEPVARFYAAEVLLTLEYLHERNIAYRDLKTENVLIGHDGHIRLTDFGFAKVVPSDCRTFTLCGTPDYSAPEVILNKGHGKAVDWWALGILLYEMIVGQPPFYDDDLSQCYKKILEGQIYYPETMSPEAKDIISQLLQHDLSKRLGCQHRGVLDVKNHPMFAGMPWVALREKKYPPPHIPILAGPLDTSCFDEYESMETDVEPSITLTHEQAMIFKDF